MTHLYSLVEFKGLNKITHIDKAYRNAIFGALPEFKDRQNGKKRHKGYRYTLRPSLFGDESMRTIQNRITEGPEAGATVGCVFDEDVSQWNETERKRMTEIPVNMTTIRTS